MSVIGSYRMVFSDLINFKNIILIAITKGAIYGVLIFGLMLNYFKGLLSYLPTA